MSDDPPITDPNADPNTDPSIGPSIDPYIDQVLNQRFRIEAKLGAGGYGVVYQALDLENDERVALKLLHPHIASDHQVASRFRREGLVLQKLRSPHIVLVREFAYAENGALYLAMELLEGRSLREVVHHEVPIEWRRALTIVSQACLALAEAHAIGVVHRDLKPENIFLAERLQDPEFVKILDFGIAKVLGGDQLGLDSVTQLTGRGRTVGTVRYMSPEQLMGRALDGRSDMYTLGVVLYRLLTGRMPFTGARKPGALILAQMQKDPRSPSEIRPDRGIPDGVDRLVLRMLGREPKDRFPSMVEVGQVCEDLLALGEWDDDGIVRTVPNQPQRLVARTPTIEITDSLIIQDTVDETGVTESPVNVGVYRPARPDTVDETGMTAAARFPDDASDADADADEPASRARILASADKHKA